MNKKVLTLCAGFLLAGGMLSNLSAEKLSAVADNGKYYKMEEGAFINLNGGSSDWTTENARGWYLDLNDNGTAVINQNADDYWKVVSVEGGYALVNFEGKTLKVNNSEVFKLGETEQWPTIPENLSQLLNGTTDWIGYSISYELGSQTEGYAVAWDAVEAATSGDVNASWLNYDLAEMNAIRFAINNGSKAENGVYGFTVSNVFRVVYNKSTQTYTLIDNVTDKALVAKGDNAGVDSYIVEKDEKHGAYLKDATSGKYVQLQIEEKPTTVAGAILVDDKEDATCVGFQVVYDQYVPVRALNVLEKNGFSVTVYYDEKTDGMHAAHLNGDIAGNPFKGHLTTMVWSSKDKKFVNATSGDVFYLKNEAGDFIVAQKYKGQGSVSAQALYGFTTVKEADLKHYLIRKAEGNWKPGETEYFGLFAAMVDGVDFDADPNALTKVDALTYLTVCVDESKNSWAQVARYDFTNNNVTSPTLVASENTGLYPIYISLGDRQIVDWTKFVQRSFFTVAKKTKDAKDNGFLVAKSNGKQSMDVNYAFEGAYGNELEGEWALTAVIKNKQAVSYTFTNRENPNCTFTFDNAQALYYKAGAEYTYKYLGDEFEIKPVATGKFDGYEILDTDDELNQKWNIAFNSNVFGSKAYMTENHDDAVNADYHVVGLTTDKEEALEFSVMKYAAPYKKDENTKNHIYQYHPADTIYVVSELGTYNAATKSYATVKDTLRVFAYSFVNQWNEPLNYGKVSTNDEGYRSLVTYTKDGKTYKYATAGLGQAHEGALKFAIRKDGENCNLRPVTFTRGMLKETELPANWTSKMYQVFDNKKAGDLNKMYAGDAANGILDNINLYDRTENDWFSIEKSETEIYRRLAQNVDTVSIFRDANNSEMLYENTTEIAEKVFVNFLGLGNIAQMKDMAPAMLADTAYVRYNTYKPQYMLIVNPTIHEAGKLCPICGKEDCEHAVPTNAWTEGRILVNLVDSANAWDAAHKHQVGNPYKKEGYNKLGFINAIHRSDSLIVGDKQQFIGNNDNHIAKFQFRYVDNESGSFVIETAGGYLKNLGGDIVVVPDMKNADVFNMTEGFEGNPTANEEISASSVVVAGVNGAVVVKGAEGKNVIVSTILGKVVANETIASDNAQIAAPAGIVVVSVDGESFKVVVK